MEDQELPTGSQARTQGAAPCESSKGRGPKGIAQRLNMNIARSGGILQRRAPVVDRKGGTGLKSRRMGAWDRNRCGKPPLSGGTRVRLGLALLGLALLPACGGSPRLKVSVLDSSGSASAPLKDAQVKLQTAPAGGAAPSEKTTGSSGQVDFDKLQPGVYEVQALKSGYSSAQAVLRFPEKHELQLTLHQVYSAHGSVLFPDGRPVPEAVVYFVSADQQHHAAVMSGSEYRIEGLPPAIYQIQAGTRDRLYSITIEGFVLQGNVARDLTLDEMPPQFDMPEDEPLAVPSATGRGRVPKQ
jgi:hypothetical protein